VECLSWLGFGYKRISSQMMKRLSFLFLIFILSSCATAPKDVATICYLPFDRETFGPVDRKLIEKYKCADTEYTDPLYKKLLEYLYDQNQVVAESSGTHFDEMRVRLKFVSERSVFFVDADGSVSVGNRQYRLSPDNEHAISKMLAAVFDYDDNQ
jgi:hypothetical protein